MIKSMKILLLRCLTKSDIPETKEKAPGCINTKKNSDKQKMNNYRPVRLLPHLYKLLTKIVTNELIRRSPSCGAGRILKRFQHYIINLSVHLEKNAMSITNHSTLHSLTITKPWTRCICILFLKSCHKVYEFSKIHMRKLNNQNKRTEDIKTNKISINRGDSRMTISSKLFTLAL